MANELVQHEELNEVKAPARFDPFTLMDKMDDEAIVAELEGQIIEDLVYHVPARVGEREVWALSKAGVDEAAKELATKKGEVLRELQLEWEADWDREVGFFRVLAARFAVSSDGREVMLDSSWGTKLQSMKMTLRDGSVVPNPFWFEQGSMKAARNARMRLIGGEIKARIIAFAKEKGKYTTVQGNGAPRGEVGPDDPFPFGKHKGVPMRDVPGGYLRSAVGIEEGIGDDELRAFDDDAWTTITEAMGGWIDKLPVRQMIVKELKRRATEAPKSEGGDGDNALDAEYYRQELADLLSNNGEWLREYEQKELKAIIENPNATWATLRKMVVQIQALVDFREFHGTESSVEGINVKDANAQLFAMKESHDKQRLLLARFNDERKTVRDLAKKYLLEIRETDKTEEPLPF